MFRLVYSSVSVVALRKGELEKLMGTSRERNAADGITGLLVHVISHDEVKSGFIQVLEGDRETVERTYARIEHDELHYNLTILMTQDVPARAFGDWSIRLEQTSPEHLRSILQDPATPNPGTLNAIISNRTTIEAIIGHYSRPNPGVAPEIFSGTTRSPGQG